MADNLKVFIRRIKEKMGRKISTNRLKRQYESDSVPNVNIKV